MPDKSIHAQTVTALTRAVSALSASSDERFGPPQPEFDKLSPEEHATAAESHRRAADDHRDDAHIRGADREYHRDEAAYHDEQADLHTKAAGKTVSASSFPWHLAAEADDAMGQAYLKLHAMKAAFDRMEEIPAALRPLYNQILLAAGTADRKETHQLREMTRKYAQKYHGA